MTNALCGSQTDPKSHLQDLTEWNPNPIIEINMEGEIVYLNLIARAQFPNLLNKGVNHPILMGLTEKTHKLDKTSSDLILFTREIQFLDRIYEQQIFSVAKKQSLFIYMNDITTHKYVEDQLKIKNAQLTNTTAMLNNILESSIEYSIIATDLNGDILVWNEGAHRNYGYTADQIINKENIKMIFTKEDIQSGQIKMFMDSIQMQEKVEGVFENVRNDGSSFVSNIVLTLRRNEYGLPVGYELMSKDITKQKQLEEQLIKSNQELEQFAYVASHDLKAPLRAIEMLAEWIEEDNVNALNDKSRDNLALLRSRVNRMGRLIDGILQYSRLGNTDMCIDTIDTKQLLLEVIDNLNPPPSFTIHYSDALPTLRGERIFLNQVFSNLISNSIKHHHRDTGNIYINAKDIGNFYAFSVTDDGPGIEPEYHEKIFQIFQTLKRKDEVENTGIGLSIVKKIVESQGGTITVDSRAGEGTTFCFTWPKQARSSHK